MTLIAERIVVVAKEFLNDKNINDSSEFNQPLFVSKLTNFDWPLNFAAASVFCEIVWKIGVGQGMLSVNQQLDRLFSPSPIATHANFRGSRNSYKTGNMPEPGSIAFWKRGNSYQGHMAIVTDVHEEARVFDVIEARILEGSEAKFLKVGFIPGKQVGLPFREDKMNLLGFVYPPAVEIR